MFWANGAALLHSQANRLLVSQQASQPRAWTAAALMQGCEQEAHWFSGGPQLAHLWGHSEPQITLRAGLTLETWQEVGFILIYHCPTESAPEWK